MVRLRYPDNGGEEGQELTISEWATVSTFVTGQLDNPYGFDTFAPHFYSAALWKGDGL